MEKSTLHLLFFLFFFLLVAATIESTPGSNPNATSFIRSSCRATRYPLLCFQSLSSYANVIQQNEMELAHTALSVSLSSARSAAQFVNNVSKSMGLKPREYRAMKDCIENMGDAVNQLERSIVELGQMGRVAGEKYAWCLSNIQTWVSTALTDGNSCLDGFAGQAMVGNIRGVIKDRVFRVVQVTSNALALVSRYASRHPRLSDKKF